MNKNIIKKGSSEELFLLSEMEMLTIYGGTGNGPSPEQTSIYCRDGSNCCS